VGLARHFQDPAQFSQPVIHPGQFQANRMPLAQPVLNSPWPASTDPIATRPAVPGGHRLICGTAPPPCSRSSSPAKPPALSAFIQSKNRRRLMSNCSAICAAVICPLAASRAASRRCWLFTSVQIRNSSATACAKSGPVQMVSLRHPPLCLPPQNSAISN